MNLSQLEAQLAGERERLSVMIAGFKDESGNIKSVTDAQMAQLETLEKSIESLSAQYKTAKRLYDLDKSNSDAQKGLNFKSEKDVPAFTDSADDYDAMVKSLAYGTPRGVLKAIGKRSPEDIAYGWGLFAHTLFGRNTQKSIKSLKRLGFEVKAVEELTNVNGGFLVPELLEASIIDLRERYGVFRRYADVFPMGSEIVNRPRRTAGATVYYPGEAGSITASTPTWDNVKLSAIKMATLVYMSSEIAEDAVINLGTYIANEIAYAFSYAEDDNGFNGDGTSTYGSMVGIRPHFKALSSTIANIAGLFVGAGNAYSELLLTDFEGVAGLLPEYADGDNVAWYVHKSFYYNVMVKLALAAGGVTATEIAGGRRVPMFLGYPVVFSQVMPKTEANSQVCCLFGDLAKSTTLGVRRGVEIATSEHAAFTTDQLAIRGTQRVALNAHDLGNASATAALRVPGPLVGLITAAS
jgi:HK97 family phage major capsid protein